MKFFDVFCGAGGLSLGLAVAGLKPLGGFDNNANAIRTYRKNLSRFNNNLRLIIADAFTYPPEELSKEIKELDPDVIVGCPPCQGFSKLRVNRFGPDRRNDLVLYFAQLVRLVKPSFVLFENVPGIVRDPRFEALLRILSESGYAYTYAILDAADYGVPQHRKRLILIASRSCKDISLPEPDHGSPESREVVRGLKKPWRTVRDAIGDLPPVEHGECHPSDPLHCAMRLPEHWLRLIKAIPKNGGSRYDAPLELWLPAHRRLYEKGMTKWFSDVFGRMRWDRPAPTITTGFYDPSRGRFVHPEQDRGLTLREGARLQTFPDDVVFEGSFRDIARQIGEAFPPLLAEKIVRRAFK